MLTIRPAGALELASIVAMEADRDTAEWLGEIGPAWHRRALDDPAVEHLIADVAGTPVGFAVLAGLGGAVVELRRVVIAAGARRTGHGRALLRASVSRACRRHGAERVWLDVKRANLRARALYESEGFVETGTHPADETDGTGHDLLFLVRPAVGFITP